MLLAEDKKQLFRKQLFWHKTMLMCNKKAKGFWTNTQLSIHPDCTEMTMKKKVPSVLLFQRFIAEGQICQSVFLL